MAVRISGQPGCCTRSCTEAKIQSNVAAATFSNILFYRQRRLISFTISVIGNPSVLLAAGTLNVSLNSVNNFFQKTGYSILGDEYQVNIVVQDPDGGCSETITFTSLDATPDITPGPVNPT